MLRTPAPGANKPLRTCARAPWSGSPALAERCLAHGCAGAPPYSAPAYCATDDVLGEGEMVGEGLGDAVTAGDEPAPMDGYGPRKLARTVDRGLTAAVRPVVWAAAEWA